MKEKPSDAGNTGDAEQVQEGLWIAGIDAEGYSYTGAAIKPSVRVYYGNQLLRAGTEYSIAYKNNVQVGKGSKLSARTYEVVLQNIATLYAYGIDKTFNEKKKGAYYMSAPVIYDVDGKKLALKKDYTVSYYNATKGEVLDKNSVVSAGGYAAGDRDRRKRLCRKLHEGRIQGGDSC